MKYLAIFGVPRSGTSWLGQLFNSSVNVAYRYQPLFSYAFKGRLSLQSSREDIEQFHRELLETKDEFVLQLKNVSGEQGMLFSKETITHLVWKEVRYLHLAGHLLETSDLLAVGIIRHPCAVIHSWLKAPREFSPDWNPLEEWRFAGKKNAGKPESFYGFEKWKEIFQMFHQLEEKYPGRFRVLYYENLVKNPSEKMQQLFDFAGIPFAAQTIDFIRESTSVSTDDPYGVHKIKSNTDEWKSMLDSRIIQAISSNLQQSGIDYEE